ncbi:DNA repair protein RecO [Terrisporobacter sp.]
MVIVNTQAIVLKSVPYKENDLILTVFSRKLGKIAVIARGAKKSKSSLLSSSQIFAYSNFTLKREGSMYRVTQSEIIKSFYNLSYNFEAFSYATYILKLIDNFMIENQSNNRLFVLLAQSLYLLCEEIVDMKYIVLCFELKFLDYIGFKPIVNMCVNCYNKDINNPVFNIYEGGILCEKCSEHFQHNLNINVTTVKLMEYILSNDILTCSKAKVSKYLIEELSKILKIYMSEYLGKINEKSLNLLESLNKKEWNK